MCCPRIAQRGRVIVAEFLRLEQDQVHAPLPMASFKDHFSAHAAQYAAHRPTYPPALVDALADLAGGTRLALDCGCGTGQLSVPLAARFDRVIAIDGSAAQIAAA